MVVLSLRPTEKPVPAKSGWPTLCYGIVAFLATANGVWTLSMGIAQYLMEDEMERACDACLLKNNLTYCQTTSVAYMNDVPFCVYFANKQRLVIVGSILFVVGLTASVLCRTRK